MNFPLVHLVQSPPNYSPRARSGACSKPSPAWTKLTVPPGNASSLHMITPKHGFGQPLLCCGAPAGFAPWFSGRQSWLVPCLEMTACDEENGTPENGKLHSSLGQQFGDHWCSSILSAVSGISVLGFLAGCFCHPYLEVETNTFFTRSSFFITELWSHPKMQYPLLEQAIGTNHSFPNLDIIGNCGLFITEIGRALCVFISRSLQKLKAQS